jgi:hypothetical protein
MTFCLWFQLFQRTQIFYLTKLIQDISHRVGWNTGDPDLIMKMGTCCPSSHPNLCDLVTSFHPLSGFHQNFVEVSISGNHPKSMGDHQNPSEADLLSRYTGMVRKKIEENRGILRGPGGMDGRGRWSWTSSSGAMGIWAALRS